MTSFQDLILYLSPHNINNNNKVISSKERVKFESIWFGIITTPIVTDSYQKYQQYITTQNITKKRITTITTKKEIETNELLLKPREIKYKRKEILRNDNQQNSLGLCSLPKEKEFLKIIVNNLSIINKINEIK